MGLFGNPSEKAAKKVAARVGVAWPPAHWATLKTPSQGALALTVLLFTDDELVYGHKRLKLAGAKATVDTSGNTAMAQGWVVKERSDTRQCFLTVESDESFVLPLKPEAEGVARSLAARINSRSKALTQE